MTEKRCKHPGCEGKHSAKGYCHIHYCRSKRGSDMDQPIRDVQQRGRPSFCSQAECPNVHWAKGYCVTHYRRLRAGADLNSPIQRAWQYAEIGYSGAHCRVRLMWGSASQYPCIECGQPAAQWAYDGTDPVEFYGPAQHAWLTYSVFPEFYMPMCKSCHKARDGARMASELREFRSWKASQRKMAVAQ